MSRASQRMLVQSCGWSVAGSAALLMALAFGPAPDAFAQTTVPDVAAYREARRAATVVFLDRSAARTARLEAAKSMGYPDDETFASLLRIGQDRSEDDSIRLEALQRHRYDPAYVAAVLKILGDSEDGGEELDAALIADLSRRTIRRPPPETQQALQSTLRRLLNDSRDKVRLNAYRALASNHDEVALQSLTTALRGNNKPPVPLVEAVGLLDLDGPVNHIATLRPYLSHPDSAVRASVARSLAIDPQSRARIVAMATDHRAPNEVRIAALRGLSRTDTRFSTYAIVVMEDSRNSNAVRLAAMSDMAGRLNYQRPDRAEIERFTKALQRIGHRVRPMSAQPDALVSEAQRVMEFMRQSFPEILR